MPLEQTKTVDIDTSMMIDESGMERLETLSEKCHFTAVHAQIDTEQDESKKYLQKLEAFFLKIQQVFVQIETRRRFIVLLNTVEADGSMSKVTAEQRAQAAQSKQNAEQENNERRQKIESTCAEIESLATQVVSKNEEFQTRLKELRSSMEQLQKAQKQVEQLEQRLPASNRNVVHQTIAQSAAANAAVMSELFGLVVQQTDDYVWKYTSKAFDWIATITFDQTCNVVEAMHVENSAADTDIVLNEAKTFGLADAFELLNIAAERVQMCKAASTRTCKLTMEVGGQLQCTNKDRWCRLQLESRGDGVWMHEANDEEIVAQVNDWLNEQNGSFDARAFREAFVKMCKKK